jgi:salicylate hydroxylase
VYERATAFRPIGGALGIQPNGFEALHAIDPDLCKAIYDRGTQNGITMLVNAHDSSVVNRVENKPIEHVSVDQLAQLAEVGIDCVQPYPFVWISWSNLQSVLRESLPEDAILLQHRLESFQQVRTVVRHRHCLIAH